MTPWRIVADETGTCNCAWRCPCQFNALPTHGRCEALVAVRIREGHYGDTPLDGVTYAAAYRFPGAVHEGNGIVQLAIDEKATPEQRTALLNIASGKEGGTLFEISVTGEEHRARIQRPNGFEFKMAEMGDCVENRATLGDKTISNRNSYAQFAAVDWTNA